MSKEKIMEHYEKLAQENQQTLGEIQENKLPPVISEKAKKTIIKTVRAVLGGGMVAGIAVPLVACEEAPPVVEEQLQEKGQETTSTTEAKEKIPSTTETAPETTAEVEKVDAPEIKGETFSLTFNQEDKTYRNETGEIVGVWVEDAVKIEGKLLPAVALNTEILKKIMAEDKEKGVFKCPWPFNFQKNRGIEMEELFFNSSYEQRAFKNQGIYLPNFIGIKYSEPIDFYGTFDIDKSMGHVTENIPDQEGPDFFSAQPWKNLIFGNKIFGGLQYNFIDWEPIVELSKAENLGNNDAYLQNILEEIKCGDFLGKILPKTADFTFLDFCDNGEFYENLGQFQGRLLITAASDDFSKKISSIERTLRYKNEAGQEIPVGVWSEENTAHEQNN